MNDDELLDAARDAGLPVQEETKHVGKCANPDCDNELPDDGPKKMNLGLPEYCGLGCRLNDEEAGDE